MQSAGYRQGILVEAVSGHLEEHLKREEGGKEVVHPVEEELDERVGREARHVNCQRQGGDADGDDEAGLKVLVRAQGEGALLNRVLLRIAGGSGRRGGGGRWSGGGGGGLAVSRGIVVVVVGEGGEEDSNEEVDNGKEADEGGGVDEGGGGEGADGGGAGLVQSDVPNLGREGGGGKEGGRWRRGGVCEVREGCGRAVVW